MGNDLIRQDNGLQKQFTPHESKMIELALKRKIYLYEVKDAVREIKNIVFLSHQIINKVINAEEATTMAGLLYERMLDTYPSVTLEELKLVSLKGSAGDYGEYFGLNVKTYLGFVSEYLLSDKRKQSISKYKEENRSKEETKKLTIKQWKELIQSDYKLYIEGAKDLIAFTEKKYLLLIKLRIIHHASGLEWVEWVNKGKEYLSFKKRIEAKKQQDNTILNQVVSLAQSFENGEIEKRDLRAVVFAARKLRYFSYFDYCIKNNITDLFKQE